MAQFSTPRIAHLHEFDEAMAFTDRVFRPDKRGRRILQRQYPHAYRETASFARRLLLLRDPAAGDALVGCLAMHPMTMRTGAARISAGGIGIVGADPARRGEGIMTTLLQDALVRMREDGQAISLLGGDRQRYGWFGWENGGVQHRYVITRRTLGDLTPLDRGLKIEPFNAADRPACRAIHALAAARSVGVDHPVSQVAPLYDRAGRETWVIREGSRRAFLSLQGAGRRSRPYETVDAALGDPDLIIGGLRRLMARFRRGQLSVLAGPNPAEAALFEPWAASWQTRDDGMIRILDLPRLLKQIEPEIRRRRRLVGVKAPDLDLTLSDLGQQGRLIGGGDSAMKLVMSTRQLVLWLFGSRPLPTAGLALGIRPSVLAAWSALLPLPLHVPPLQHI